MGGYTIPQYRKKNWQIPKYRVENRRNIDTAFMIGHAYVTLYLSRMFVYFMHVCTSKTSAIASKRKITNNDRKAWSLYAATISLYINYHLLKELSHEIQPN